MSGTIKHALIGAAGAVAGSAIGTAGYMAEYSGGLSALPSMLPYVPQEMMANPTQLALTAALGGAAGWFFKKHALLFGLGIGVAYMLYANTGIPSASGTQTSGQ